MWVGITRIWESDLYHCNRSLDTMSYTNRRKKIRTKEAQYCKLMRKSFEVAVKDRERSNSYNDEAMNLKKEINLLKNGIQNK